MLAHTRLLLWTLLVASLSTSFWGSFEFATTLTEQGIIQSPIWSGTLGYPVPHHYIIGFIGAAASIIVMELKSRRDRREAKPDR
jgi:hypothetical protein